MIPLKPTTSYATDLSVQIATVSQKPGMKGASNMSYLHHSHSANMTAAWMPVGESIEISTIRRYDDLTPAYRQFNDGTRVFLSDEAPGTVYFDMHFRPDLKTVRGWFPTWSALFDAVLRDHINA